MKRKIILIIFLPKFVISGAGRSVFEMINGLNKKKFSIKVICFGKCEYKKKLRKKIDIYELKTNRIIFSISKILNIIKLIKNVSKKNKLIFISNHHYANVVGFFVKRKIHEIKIIGIERTPIFELKTFFSFKDLIRKKILMLCVKLIYPHLDKIVANSNFIQNEIRKFSPKNTKVIYPPSFIINKKNQVNKLGLRILMVGSLNKEKGIDLVLKTLSKINNDFVLIVVGRGPEKNNLITLSKKLFGKNYKNKIKFVGHKINLKNYYLKSNLFLNTSYFEGFSNAIIDAMNYNIPVIASNCAGGNQEILGYGKYGTIFKSQDEIDLKAKICSFIKNKEIYFNKTKLAKQNIKKYSFKKSIKKYSKLFEKI